jgi:hypothetical protein
MEICKELKICFHELFSILSASFAGAFAGAFAGGMIDNSGI